MSACLLVLEAVAQAPAPAQSSASAEWPLWGSYALANPEMLLALPVLLLALFIGRRDRARPSLALTLPQLAAGQKLPAPSARQRLAWLALACKAAALCLFALALARPISGNEERELTSEGVDIVLAVDRSGSMQFDDLERGKSRLEVVKQVVADFAEKRMSGSGGTRDNVGLVTFARYPELLCPPTLDINALTGFLKTVDLVRIEAEDGTAIGAGLAKAVAVLQGSKAKSKVVVLLTDGQNNVSDIAPAEAAKLAASEGVRVYTVMAGRYVQDFFNRLVEMESELDSSDLENIAAATHGRFFRAKDKQALEQVYAEIDRLEKTAYHEKRYVETFDLYPWLLAPGLLLYLLAWLWGTTFGRALP